MSFIRPPVAFSLALTLMACAKVDERPTDSTSIPAASSTDGAIQIQPPGGIATPATSTPGTSTPANSWTVTERGIGKLRAGMTVAEARAVVPGFTVPAGGDASACTYGKADGLPAGVGVMVEGGKVVRVEVRRGEIATSTGARIGDSEEKIKSRYPGRVSVSPHKYTDGHYLTVAPPSPADSAYRIIFETDGEKVLSYRAGIRPQVEYVEGCS